MSVMASRARVAFRLFVVLSVWVFAGGLTWVDSCDLNDELASPLAGMAQAVESDVDEVKHDVLERALTPGLLEPTAVLLRSRPLMSAKFSEAVSDTSDCPLYQRLSTYRI